MSPNQFFTASAVQSRKNSSELLTICNQLQFRLLELEMDTYSEKWNTSSSENDNNNSRKLSMEESEEVEYSDSDSESDDGAMGGCLWDTEQADLYLRVHHCLLPVHRHLVSANSKVLRRQIDQATAERNQRDEYNSLEDDDHVYVISTEESSLLDVKEFLAFVYHPRRVINDANVLWVLRLAEQFQSPKLKAKCEDYFVKNRSMYNPLDLLHIANEYNLDKVLRQAKRRVSKMTTASCEDFRKLDFLIQTKARRRSKTEKVKNHNNGDYSSVETFRKRLLSVGEVDTNSASDSFEDVYDADSSDTQSDEDIDDFSSLVSLGKEDSKLEQFSEPKQDSQMPKLRASFSVPNLLKQFSKLTIKDILTDNDLSTIFAGKV